MADVFGFLLIFAILSLIIVLSCSMFKQGVDSEIQRHSYDVDLEKQRLQYNIKLLELKHSFEMEKLKQQTRDENSSYVETASTKRNRWNLFKLRRKN